MSLQQAFVMNSWIYQRFMCFAEVLKRKARRGERRSAGAEICGLLCRLFISCWLKMLINQGVFPYLNYLSTAFHDVNGRMQPEARRLHLIHFFVDYKG